MNNGATHSAKLLGRCGAGLAAWLATNPRGRWLTARGRCVQAILTGVLILTGVFAWALALVQPWTGRGGDRGIVAVAAGMDPMQVRAASVDALKLVGEPPPAAPRPLRRNVFAAAKAPGPGLSAAVNPTPAGPAKVKPVAAATAAGLAPQKILETVKTLRLEIILVTPAGERWAVINGENYKEGDAIAGLEIVEIQEARVKLQQGGLTCLLRMD